MRIRRLLAVPVALMVPAAIIVISATGVLGPGTWGGRAGAAPVAGGHGGGWGGGHCVLVLPHQRVGPGRRPPARAGSGDISVSIPPTVFIRTVGSGIVVTTNTGAPPSAADGFWVLDGNRATPAPPSLRAEVLAGCWPS